MALKPNTICKNPNCRKGKNGKPKKYYTCFSCIKRQNWRTVACSKECFAEYLQAVRERNFIPKRTDMSEEEVLKIIKDMPEKEVRRKTEEELKDYKKEMDIGGISMAVEKANKDIDNEKREGTQ